MKEQSTETEIIKKGNIIEDQIKMKHEYRTSKMLLDLTINSKDLPKADWEPNGVITINLSRFKKTDSINDIVHCINKEFLIEFLCAFQSNWDKDIDSLLCNTSKYSHFIGECPNRRAVKEALRTKEFRHCNYSNKQMTPREAFTNVPLVSQCKECYENRIKYG